ncbi:hypothetical protein C9374_005227 [Naegleria lovaniensis]|uniref:Uncharacterized protein n=1 Tax=Naegleria lovaniensis TaxID=51637 RepID=A0AA88GQH4_NAELO|nr:uncharacterized protein C9374_005227 [Naegleria lovaniensis]KAG2382647.1 hypothetical protein C9374_005227 [Naegleria lovaniensis]
MQPLHTSSEMLMQHVFESLSGVGLLAIVIMVLGGVYLYFFYFDSSRKHDDNQNHNISAEQIIEDHHDDEDELAWFPTNEHQLCTDLSTLSVSSDDPCSSIPISDPSSKETKLHPLIDTIHVHDEATIGINRPVASDTLEAAHSLNHEPMLESNHLLNNISMDSPKTKINQQEPNVAHGNSSSTTQHDHLLSKHSFLMVCSKCNYLFATFLPPSRLPEQEHMEFPERFTNHPFTFGVLKLDNDNRRRNVAFMPRFHQEYRMKDEQEDDKRQEEEKTLIPTLCFMENSPLEQEFICKKIEESELSQMKDVSKRERDAGKLLRLYCKNCNTKVGSCLKEPLKIQVAPGLSLPFNTFMDQQDCSIVEKCHCEQQMDDSKYIDSNNIVITDEEDRKTFRKTTLGEWKYSSLASMLFEMPESRKDLKPQKRNFMQNKFHHKSLHNKKFPPHDNSKYPRANTNITNVQTQRKKGNNNHRQQPSAATSASEPTKKKKGQKRKKHPKTDGSSSVQNAKLNKQ